MEEARKGQQEKAEQGIWPTQARLGYRNVAGPDGKKIIVPDPNTAGIIAHLFGWYATGTLSLKEAAEKARSAGLIYRRTGAGVPVSSIHTVLCNRIYIGEFDWKGYLYKGRHQPLITRELWEHFQGVLDGRHSKKTRKSTASAKSPGTRPRASPTLRRACDAWTLRTTRDGCSPSRSRRRSVAS